MKTLMSQNGLLAACLLLCLQACTPKQAQKTIPLRAAEPVVVTKVQYRELPASLLPVIDSPLGFTHVWANGDMYQALVHDSAWLDTCKGALDGIRGLAPLAPGVPATRPAQAPTPAARPPGQ